jgi:hypothetical protein
MKLSFGWATLNTLKAVCLVWKAARLVSFAALKGAAFRKGSLSKVLCFAVSDGNSQASLELL